MLHCAASRGRMVLTDWLLDNIFMDNPNVKNDLGETPLHLAAGYFTKGIQSLFTITIIYFLPLRVDMHNVIIVLFFKQK